MVDRILEIEDAELACCSLIMYGDTLQADAQSRLVNTIISNSGNHRGEYAYFVLRYKPSLNPDLRNRLLEYIVESDDGQSAHAVLQRLQDLGDWEPKLKEVVERHRGY